MARHLQVHVALALYLEAAGLPQKWIADETGLDSSSVSRVLSGSRGLSNVSARAIVRAMSDAFASGRVKVPPLTLADLLPAKREAA